MNFRVRNSVDKLSFDFFHTISFASPSRSHIARLLPYQCEPIRRNMNICAFPLVSILFFQLLKRYFVVGAVAD